MVSNAYLFLDFEKHPAHERQDMQLRIQAQLPYHTFRVVNFFTSSIDDLLIISKYRVVSLPTMVVLDDKKKVLIRLLHIPIDTEIHGLLDEDTCLHAAT